MTDDWLQKAGKQERKKQTGAAYVSESNTDIAVLDVTRGVSTARAAGGCGEEMAS